VSDCGTLQGQRSLTICFSIRHLGVGVHLAQILLVACGCGLDRLVARVPVGGAHLAVLVCELESVDQTQGLVYAAADGEVVDSDLETAVLVHVSFRVCGTGKHTCRTVPAGSIKNNPRSAIPSSSIRTP
jgi:hypothetical protein